MRCLDVHKDNLDENYKENKKRREVIQRIVCFDHIFVGDVKVNLM